MIVVDEERFVESPYVEWVGNGYTATDGSEMRPAEYNWHLVVARHESHLRILVTGALEEARLLNCAAGVKCLWIRFKVGTYMPHLPPSATVNQEINLPPNSGNGFWLQDKVWEIPTFHNADIFVESLAQAHILTCDPVINAVLCDELKDTSVRTTRYHFQRSTGLRQGFIQQIKRAQKAMELLQHGSSILDTAHELGYADQPHLTRSLKRLLGYTPHQILTSALNSK